MSLPTGLDQRVESSTHPSVICSFDVPHRPRYSLEIGGVVDTDCLAVRLGTREVLREHPDLKGYIYGLHMPDVVPEDMVLYNNLMCRWESAPDMALWLAIGDGSQQVNLIDPRQVRAALGRD